MRDVFVVSDNIISPLGLSSADNFRKLRSGISGIKLHDKPAFSPNPFYASLLDNENFLEQKSKYTKFEQLLIASIIEANRAANIDMRDEKTILIISSTKGNISLLETNEDSPELRERIALHTSAQLIADYFKYPHRPVVVSNACISGSLAILTAFRLIQSGAYEHAVVAGADVISKFILSGFNALFAISPNPCKPFDADRDGITLGEGAATLIISARKNDESNIKISGGATSNDANHISGPSRTGEPLFMAITKALQNAKLTAADIDFISAHGTATTFNDEMEAKALIMANLQSAHINSLKGYFGHTLGASGLIESIISVHSLKENCVIASAGFKNPGVTSPINICTELQTGNFKHCLKTASGFGGCNAALVMSKVF